MAFDQRKAYLQMLLSIFGDVLWVRYRLQGKLKVPRPVSIKQKEGVVEEFKKNCHH